MKQLESSDYIGVFALEKHGNWGGKKITVLESE